MKYAFGNCTRLLENNISNFITSNVIDMEGLFSYTNLYSIDLRNFNTSQLKYMARMFYGCQRLNSINLINFNTSNVFDYQDCFKGISDSGTLEINSSIFNKNITKELSNSWIIIDVNKKN